MGTADNTTKQHVGRSADYSIFDAALNKIDLNTAASMPCAKPIDLSIFISCFNEMSTVIVTAQESLEVAESHGISLQFIFIDDGSTDQSVDTIKKWMSDNKDRANMLLIERHINAGLGANFKLAAILAQGHCFRLMCGDHPEPQSAVDAIFSAFGRGHVVLPYHVTVQEKSKWRRGLSHSFSHLINLTTGLNVKYYNGQPIFTRLPLLMHLPQTSGFGFQAESVAKLLLGGERYVEVPVHTIQKGESTAVSCGNLVSVAHTIVILLLARASHIYHRNKSNRKRD